MKKLFLLFGILGLGMLLMGANFSGVQKIDNSARTIVTQAEPTLVTGSKIIAGGTGVATQLYTTTGRCVQGVYLSTLASNSLPVWIGPSTMTAGTGYALDAGNKTFVPVTDPSTIYGVTSQASTLTTGSSVTFMFSY